MSMIPVLLMVVEVVVCLMLIGLVLIQRSKGDGLSAAIGGGVGEAMFGAQIGNVVTRATVILGIVFLLNTIVLSLVLSKSAATRVGSVTDDVPASTAVASPDSTTTFKRGPSMPIAPSAETPASAAPVSMPAAIPAAAAPVAAPAASAVPAK